ncbi:aldose 1-epimerase family protein [Saccharicrinis sp. GN24d3]|uniref:aldose 1-epimerase family protein n=1 Tax=Saccharicrinis sp. GN24d3 TaxID=3458416 RepID=UPI0040358836
MIHTIQNNFLSVSVLHKGAEISSLKSLKTGQEFMWNANPDIWGSHAPVLFPIIGCLKDGKYNYKGKEYSIPKHGILRNNENLELESISKDSLTLKYTYDAHSLKMFPFEFEFYITFKLVESKLIVDHKVVNLGDNEMLFSLGAHPGFNCPLKEGEKYSDYYLEFEHSETDHTWNVSKEGLISGEAELVLDNTNILPLTDTLFDKDALIFKNLKSRLVSLKNKNNDTTLTLSFPDFNYLGIWAKPKAPFVCIEPWLGIADSEDSNGNFEEKEGVIKVKAKEMFEAGFVVELR